MTFEEALVRVRAAHVVKETWRQPGNNYLFPGTGAVTRAWESWKARPSLLRPAPVSPWNEVAGMLND